MKSFFIKSGLNNVLTLHIFFKYHFKPKEYIQEEFINDLKKNGIIVDSILSYDIRDINENFYYTLFKRKYSIWGNDVNGYTISYPFQDKSYRFTLELK